MNIVKPNPPEQNPQRRVASPMLQVALAIACALVAAEVVDWVSAVHVFIAVLTVFTSVNRVVLESLRCVHCGHNQ